MKPQDPLNAPPMSLTQELYCSSLFAPLRNTNFIRTSVEPVLDVKHHHQENHNLNDDYQQGEVEYGDKDCQENNHRYMEEGEIDRFGLEVWGAKESLHSEESSNDAELWYNQLTLPLLDDIDFDLALEQFDGEATEGFSILHSFIKYICLYKSYLFSFLCLTQ
jgi:hypothetical protein